MKLSAQQAEVLCTLETFETTGRSYVEALRTCGSPRMPNALRRRSVERTIASLVALGLAESNGAVTNNGRHALLTAEVAR